MSVEALAHGEPEEATVEGVIGIAINLFAADGYNGTKLDAISRASGMSKRMIHYHFGDKQGLYQQALATAAARLTPELADVETDSPVPVEGMAKVVDAIFQTNVKHPECVRLLAQESVIRSLEATSGPLIDLSGMSLHVDKLLMTGQDSGAFRPGISTNDILTLIASISTYRTVGNELMLNLLNVDLNSEENIEGARRMAVDTVLAFLTSNIPDSGQESYLVAELSDDESESPADIYEDAAGIYD